MIPRLYTKREVAQMFHVSTKTVEKWVTEGQIGSIKPARNRLFKEEHIAAFLNKNEIIPYVRNK